ncbi:hypothetical protein [Endothiovibrio diazotrophicus]
MTTDPSPTPSVSPDRLAELLNQIANAVWNLENCIGVLEAAHDDELPSRYFSVEGVTELMFEIAHHSADQASEALEMLEVEYGLQVEIGVQQ